MVPTRSAAAYARAFDAKEQFRLTEPSGRVGHAEIKIGPAIVMLSDEYPEHGIRGPRSLGGTSFAIHLHVTDVDKALRRRSKRVRRFYGRCKISFMVSGQERCVIRSVTSGCMVVIWRH